MDINVHKKLILFGLIIFSYPGFCQNITVKSGPLLTDPMTVYINWAAYDELSDTVELTEKIAMKQLDEVIRLKKSGARIDYYMMDCYWFDEFGGYKTWRKPHWPSGPEAWLQKCKQNGIKPGLWIATNSMWGHNPKPIPTWEDSKNKFGYAYCMFYGGFLPDLMKTLQYWYDKGIRMYKFDFANFDASTPEIENIYTKDEIRRLNENAFRTALQTFREKNPEVVYIAYNGFGGEQGGTSQPFFKDVDMKWLETVHSLYCGDPRISDIPAINFYRSKDYYSDHMVRRYDLNNIPLERIDNTSFMICNVGTCYCRLKTAWKGMLILSLSRGGWVNTYYGDLSLLSDTDAKWFAKAQSLFLKFQAFGRIKTFGSMPGEGKPYGYCSMSEEGSIYTIVNPAQSFQAIDLPKLSYDQSVLQNGKVLFHDAGYIPEIKDNKIKLGPEQMAVIGFGKYSNPSFDLGIQTDVKIPIKIDPIDANFTNQGEKTIVATIVPPKDGDLRIFLKQMNQDGQAVRTSGGGTPTSTSLGKIFIISATQKGKPLYVEIQYDKIIWSGLSWAAGEIKASNLKPGIPIMIKLITTEKNPVLLKGEIYRVNYSNN